MKRERVVILIYFAILLIAMAGMKTIINEFKAGYEELAKENEKLQAENKQLEEELGQIRNTNDGLSKIIDQYKVETNTLREKIKTTSRGSVSRNLGKFTVTCYDLSVQSCGKEVGSKGYGMTASGVSLVGHTWKTARAIAVDPKVIPLGSKVRLTFTEEGYSKYNGIYNAVDTGGAVKGNKIDFFWGDFKQNEPHKSLWDFGKTKAIVEVIEGGKGN